MALNRYKPGNLGARGRGIDRQRHKSRRETKTGKREEKKIDSKKAHPRSSDKRKKTNIQIRETLEKSYKGEDGALTRLSGSTSRVSEADIRERNIFGQREQVQ